LGGARLPEWFTWRGLVPGRSRTSQPGRCRRITQKWLL